MARPTKYAATKPIARPANAKQHCLFENEPNDSASARAERHAQSKLVFALGDGESHYAVDSDGCKQQSHCRRTQRRATW